MGRLYYCSVGEDDRKSADGGQLVCAIGGGTKKVTGAARVCNFSEIIDGGDIGN